MITIISPAKDLDFAPVLVECNSTTPKFYNQTHDIITEYQSLSAIEILKLMKISNKIAELNFNRVQDFTCAQEKQAIFAFNGDVYKNIDKEHLKNKNNLEFAQANLRILSGLYGILKPLDLIKPHRLEMKTKLQKIAPKGLAAFWQEKVTFEINQTLSTQTSGQYLINLASAEYYASIDTQKLYYPVVDINFYELRNNKLANIAINSKKARGMMVDFIIKNNIESPEELLNFNSNNYQFSTKHSTNNNYVFIKNIS